MTKKQLLKKLEKVTDDTVIILASDTEGNSHDILGEVYIENGLKFYRDEDENNIILVNKEEIDDEYITKRQYDKFKNCVVLYP